MSQQGERLGCEDARVGVGRAWAHQEARRDLSLRVEFFLSFDVELVSSVSFFSLQTIIGSRFPLASLSSLRLIAIKKLL